ncbi:hypothetical protein FB561_5792 [Kribbella amoyensis]|uniref:HTH cro/C1-type domain-containing protein n=1 Tax=Kribbella amoyensis TaxID=996641 RepID=A0A561C084_9ACTN|nr:pyridoxamine 5'-phosphate oxidase family protein [Kribbella amoyensis]TWD84599.1 hypothetical protein FB561_5792 [Kribbella amoyensis]
MSAGSRGASPGDLGVRVHHRRSALGLTRAQVAERSGMSPNYVERVETAPATLTSGDLIRLADALDTTVTDLLGASGDRAPGHGRAGLRPRFEAMERQECAGLLKNGGIGRIAFRADEKFLVVPVNFGCPEEVVVFRTAADGPIARLGEGAVAFEVDFLDDAMRQGWSILIDGLLRSATAEEVAATRGLIEPWAGGERETYLAIEPQEITGRRIRTTAVRTD